MRCYRLSASAVTVLAVLLASAAGDNSTNSTTNATQTVAPSTLPPPLLVLSPPSPPRQDATCAGLGALHLQSCLGFILGLALGGGALLLIPFCYFVLMQRKLAVVLGKGGGDMVLCSWLHDERTGDKEARLHSALAMLDASLVNTVAHYADEQLAFDPAHQFKVSVPRSEAMPALGSIVVVRYLGLSARPMFASLLFDTGDVIDTTPAPPPSSRPGQAFGGVQDVTRLLNETWLSLMAGPSMGAQELVQLNILATLLKSLTPDVSRRLAAATLPQGMHSVAPLLATLPPIATDEAGSPAAAFAMAQLHAALIDLARSNDGAQVSPPQSNRMDSLLARASDDAAQVMYAAAQSSPAAVMEHLNSVWNTLCNCSCLDKAALVKVSGLVTLLNAMDIDAKRRLSEASFKDGLHTVDALMAQLPPMPSDLEPHERDASAAVVQQLRGAFENIVETTSFSAIRKVTGDVNLLHQYVAGVLSQARPYERTPPQSARLWMGETDPKTGVKIPPFEDR